jgi:hypothetical protein
MVQILHNAQLVLKYSVLTIIVDLNEVDITLKSAKTFRLVLSGEGGSAEGWRCC